MDAEVKPRNHVRPGRELEEGLRWETQQALPWEFEATPAELSRPFSRCDAALERAVQWLSPSKKNLKDIGLGAARVLWKENQETLPAESPPGLARTCLSVYSFAFCVCTVKETEEGVLVRWDYRA